MRSQRWAWLMLALPLGLVLWGFARIYNKNSAYSQVADQLPGERAAAKRDTIPLTPEEITSQRAVPAADNAAPIYREIVDAMQQMPDVRWDDMRPIMLGQEREGDRKQARLVLTQCYAIMQKAEGAALRTQCDFQRDFRQGILLEFPEYPYLRQLVRLFCVQAILLMEADQLGEAMRSLLTASHIIRHLGQEADVSALFNRMTLESLFERALLRIVQRGSDRPEVLQKAEQIEQILDSPRDPGKAFQTECVLRLQTLETFRKGVPHPLPSGYNPPYPLHASHNIVQDAWEARCLSFWRRTLEGVRRADNDPMDAFRAVKAINDSERRESVNARQHFKQTYELSYYMQTDYTDVAQRLVSYEAHKRLRRIQLALFAYRRKTGHFPDQLEALTPEPPVDPFARQPMHYQKTEKGFLLYSIGANLADDNGNGRPRFRGEDPPDIVLSYPPQAVTLEPPPGREGYKVNPLKGGPSIGPIKGLPTLGP